MASVRYLIVGGGPAGHGAASGIREVDPDGPIMMVGEEPCHPYLRSPLSKGLWQGRPRESVWLNQQIPGLEIRTGRRIAHLDPRAKTVVDDHGESLTYEKVLIATGSCPRPLPGATPDSVMTYRTIADYERLAQAANRGEKIAVVGSGLLGMELAASLASTGSRVVQIFPDAGVGGRYFHAELATHLSGAFKKKGVELMPGRFVTATSRDGDEVVITTDRDEQVNASLVVAALGIRPRDELARAAGIRVEDGIPVDEALQTSAPDVYAAGDVARFYNPLLGSWIRSEHEDHAQTSGVMAGRSMAGARPSYYHLPSFCSEMFDIRYESVGEISSHMQVFADWNEPFRSGVLYYLSNSRVRGVLLWGMSGQIEAARALIAEQGPFGPDDLVDRIPK